MNNRFLATIVLTLLGSGASYFAFQWNTHAEVPCNAGEIQTWFYNNTPINAFYEITEIERREKVRACLANVSVGEKNRRLRYTIDQSAGGAKEPVPADFGEQMRRKLMNQDGRVSRYHLSYSLED